VLLAQLRTASAGLRPSCKCAKQNGINFESLRTKARRDLLIRSFRTDETEISAVDWSDKLDQDASRPSLKSDRVDRRKSTHLWFMIHVWCLSSPCCSREKDRIMENNGGDRREMLTTSQVRELIGVPVATLHD
jgi:hypothetical protein